MYETMIATTIANKISQDILRKYLHSFSDNGFLGVSSGQRKKIQTADKMVINKSIV